MNMADEGINFQNLEKELSKALEADAKYQRENDAKFRAVSQKVANYDEFRDIVLASHLKPLDKNDKIGGMPYQQWNTVSGTSNDENLSNKQDNLKSKLNAPTTEAEFKRDWLKSRNSEEKYEYIVQIVGPLNLSSVLKIECDVAEISKIVNENYLEDDAKTIKELLEVMSKTKRFQLSLDFLDKMEVVILKGLVQKLRNSNVEVDDLAEKYKLK